MKLFDDHVGIAVNMGKAWAKKIGLRGIDEDELVNTSLIGLWSACQSFEPETGNKFMAYARFRIKGEIFDFLRTYNERFKRGIKRNANVSINRTIEHSTVTIEDSLRSREKDPHHKLEIKEEVDKLLASVPKRTRTILIMYYLKGLQMQEIGIAIGMSESRISQIIHELRCEIRSRRKFITRD